MSSSSSPDRQTLIATLRDYVEQLREEGMEGLPAAVPSARTTQHGSSAPGAIEAVAASEGALESVELFSKYPGLEATTTLENLREFIGDCARCKLAPFRKNLVFGVGNPEAQLMFVGEAPGADEDARGEPFVGKAGQLLTRIIQTMGFSRETVYIANVLKCRPDTPGQTAGNRKPTTEEMKTCLPYLIAQIDLIQPKVIVALGGTAVEGLL